MATIKQINGHLLKDEIARNGIVSLQESLDETNTNLETTNTNLETTNTNLEELKTNYESHTVLYDENNITIVRAGKIIQLYFWTATITNIQTALRSISNSSSIGATTLGFLVWNDTDSLERVEYMQYTNRNVYVITLDGEDITSSAIEGGTTYTGNVMFISN